MSPILDKLVTRTKRYFGVKEEIRVVTDIPKKKEPAEYITTIKNRRDIYIRGAAIITFETLFEKGEVLAVEIDMKNGKAYTHILYDFNTNELKYFIYDGYANKDNGHVTFSITDNELLINWILGSGIALGSYSIEMLTISVNETKKTTDSITIWERKPEGAEKYEKVKTAWRYNPR